MIEPYDLNGNTNGINMMLRNMMKNTFFFVVIFLSILIIVSLLIWLIRNQNKIRKGFKIWIEKFYINFNFGSFYIINTYYCSLYKIMEENMKKFKEHKFLKAISKLKWTIYTTPVFISLLNVKVYAESSISITEVKTATDNIKDAVVKLAIPIGSVLMFVSIVIIALKMIANSGNPSKRTESIGSLAWVAGGFMLLGLALIVSGIILSIATNGSGEMIMTGTIQGG